MPPVRSLDDVLTEPRRVPCGETHPFAKLQECDVREILRLYRTKSATQGQIAKMYGISRPNVSLIVARKAWAHVVESE